MTKVEPGVYYAQNIGLVHSLARKGFYRLQGIGAAMPYDDLVQELSIVFLRAYELHDPEKGSKFSTYFTHAAYNKLNRIAEDFAEERIRLNIKSVEELSSSTEDEGEYEFVACDRQTPEEALFGKRNAQDIMESLSPLATLIVGWLIDPPDFLLEEFEKTKAHTEYAKELGFDKRHRLELSVTLICDLLVLISNVSRREIARAKAELRGVVEDESKYGYSR